MSAKYNVGDELKLDNRWYLVGAVYRSTMGLLSIEKKPIRAIANLDYSSRYQTTEKPPKKRDFYIKDKGQKIFSIGQLDFGDSVFYLCLNNSDLEFRPAIFIDGRFKEGVFIDCETEQEIRIKDCRLVRAYEL